MSRSKILVVDDDAAFRSFVATLLARAGFESDQAGSGNEALASARAGRPDLVLLDVLLPNGSGFEVCRELRDLYGDELPIIFVSGERIEPHDRTAGLLIGGDDYVVKPFDPDELLARVRRSLDRVDVNGRAALSGKAVFPLTTRELEVLRLLAEENDPDTIAARLVITPKTVASHLQHAMAKLGVHSRVHAVARAYELGMIGGNNAGPPGGDVEPHGAPVRRGRSVRRPQPIGRH
jgi:two-component system nitrate/nitrite response regulator NarL